MLQRKARKNPGGDGGQKPGVPVGKALVIRL